ncbi:GcrA family cell cycle regulator [Candidatus Liberibacter sp.]|uniref:GcrA family cell cycle regulator n=1 Tax=Candidatus Liberibacter sp. TaxID=34022 RepID=UPI0015F5A072|nr:GcrA family cell cycle regulator [Candidatus Liberibacter sp.]MBA5724098.1 hypothetical protein [Candidatus Liberibacter sp.]
MSWTDERINKLKKFWSEGLSASQIAAQLGGVTRNAVIGKVHRLSLSGRMRVGVDQQSPRGHEDLKSGEIAVSKTKQVSASNSCSSMSNKVLAARTKEKSKSLEKGSASVAGVVLPIFRRLGLTELTDNTCKWPLEDPVGEDFSFCGSDVNNDSPYCDYHKRLAYQHQHIHERRGMRVNSN